MNTTLGIMLAGGKYSVHLEGPDADAVWGMLGEDALCLLHAKWDHPAFADVAKRLLGHLIDASIEAAEVARVSEHQKCSVETPCCDQRDQYNGFKSGTRLFTCLKGCMCHD